MRFKKRLFNRQILEIAMNLRSVFLVSFLATQLSILFGGIAFAKCIIPKLDPKLNSETSIKISEFGDWVTMVDENPKQCWAFSRPLDSSVRQSSDDDEFCRSESIFYILYEPGGNIRGQPSIKFGYNLSDKVDPKIFIDREIQALSIVVGEYAWLENSILDSAIFELLLKEDLVHVVGLSKDGHMVADKFSLSGFHQSTLAARNVCSSYPLV